MLKLTISIHWMFRVGRKLLPMLISIMCKFKEKKNLIGFPPWHLCTLNCTGSSSNQPDCHLKKISASIFIKEFVTSPLQHATSL